MQKLTDLQKQIEKLQKQASELRSQQFDATVADILATMKAFGITVKDLQTPKSKAIASRKSKGSIGKNTEPKGKRSVVAPKYRGPNGESWSGRGLTPKWLANQISAGQSKESFRIAVESTTTN